jgi:hypothetical protein
MAEQSIGMATGTGAGFGDGDVGSGYSSARMTAMETKTLSDGVLQVGNDLVMTGTGTGTLTIANGAAVVGGYFYENTSSASIVISTLANATYNVAILVNVAAGALNVSRSVAGTTIDGYTVRLVVATGGQLSGRTYLQLGTIVVAGANITSITPSYAMYGTTTQLPYQSYGRLIGLSATLTTASTLYEPGAPSSTDITGDNILVHNGTGGFTVRRIGLYLVNAYGVFSTGTTGNRFMGIKRNGTFVQSIRLAAAGVASQTVTVTTFINVTAVTDVITLEVSASIASQSFDSGILTISRA